MAAKRGVSGRQRADAFARFFEAVHEGVYIGDLVLSQAWEEATLAANPQLKLILGHPTGTEDAELELFAPTRFLDQAARATFLDRLATEGSVTDYLLRLRRADGDAVWVEVTARAEARPPGQALRVEALVRDVSARKQLDDQSRDVYQQLVQAEKMAALGQTISGVAHELNNPLATILSWAERLAEKTRDETTRNGLAVILRESERAARIVRNLLTFARKRQSTRSLVDINQVIRETLALRAHEHRARNITVATALSSRLPFVFADAHQIQQVLLNLAINAEQAMLAAHGRGLLDVRTRHDGARNTVILEVCDDGPGIPADVRGRIFDPFFTTKEPGAGTGLGLTVAYAIVQEHGGSIRVVPRSTEGATFTVELPVSDPSAAAQPGARAAERRIPSGASVLLVEDERALAMAVQEALIDAGLHVDHAGDGEDALARVRQHAYDLVICDLKMPRVDGISLYRAITATTPALARRVIFVTGDVAGPETERFLEASGCRWLTKPFRLGDLLRSVREALA